ncbi:MAG: TolC family protein [Burkholderiaceae bacterium]|nr:TolC family protein [Burkholderiaceae bacterium]
MSISRRRCAASPRREQARALLERYGSWLREREAARVWAEQATLLQEQAEAVAKRQRLGDAARVEQVQVEAAVAQAQAQALVAEGRARAAREALERQFPALAFPQPALLPDPPASPAGDADWIDAQLAQAPELESARRELEVAEGQLRVEQLERRPDPTVGLRVGQARDANEHYVGVVFSIPFGGEYRAAAARAAASRAAAAALRRDEVERRAATEAGLRLRETQLAWGGWQRTRLAQDKLEQAAQGLARGYQLGEGSLADVLSAGRLANEQRLGAAGAAVDAWLARWRLMLEAGRLWEESAAAAQAGG